MNATRSQLAGRRRALSLPNSGARGSATLVAMVTAAVVGLAVMSAVIRNKSLQTQMAAVNLRIDVQALKHHVADTLSCKETLAQCSPTALVNPLVNTAKRSMFPAANGAYKAPGNYLVKIQCVDGDIDVFRSKKPVTGSQTASDVVWVPLVDSDEMCIPCTERGMLPPLPLGLCIEI